MLLHFQHHVKIAGRTSIRPRLSLTRHAQPRPGIRARRNAQFNRALAVDTSLPFAIRAALLHDLPLSLARRAGAINREKSLLVNNLPAAAASLARYHSRAFLRARSVA